MHRGTKRSFVLWKFGYAREIRESIFSKKRNTKRNNRGFLRKWKELNLRVTLKFFHSSAHVPVSNTAAIFLTPKMNGLVGHGQKIVSNYRIFLEIAFHYVLYVQCQNENRNVRLLKKTH